MKCVSLNNEPCQARPTLVNTNFKETPFYQLTAIFKKCGKSCNTIDNLCA